ncbi:prepilin peptidase [Leucobacter celer]|uniref:prepilin peptidase n=1 Tax=Leucobacter celer TaxID=668625 RepID=UPI0006A7A955|nr:A24 family peptidase [Leucobacter celer]
MPTVVWWWFQGGFERLPVDADVSALVLTAYLILAAASVSLTLIDLGSFRLPNRILLPAYTAFAALTATAAIAAADPEPLARALIGSLALALFYSVLRVLSRGSLGNGDVKLAGLLGMPLAWGGWEELVIGGCSGIFLGGSAAFILVTVGGRHRDIELPLGPWMIFGAWVGIFTGREIGSRLLPTLTL